MLKTKYNSLVVFELLAIFVAGIVGFLIALPTVSWQIGREATANPVELLRCESIFYH